LAAVIFDEFVKVPTLVAILFGQLTVLEIILIYIIIFGWHRQFSTNIVQTPILSIILAHQYYQVNSMFAILLTNATLFP
jgi:hypothetical protein